MSVTDVTKDFDNLTLTLTAEFTAPAERVWQLWQDPRLLERWWGPPEYPATFEQFDFSPGGRASYYMTAPDGAKYRGWWTFSAVSQPDSLEFVDGFAHDDGTPNGEMPQTASRMTLTETEGVTRMELRATFASRADMDQLMAMQMDEGLTAAAGQMDALLGR